MPETPLLTVAEVADRLRISRQTVRRRVATGELRAVRVGHQRGAPVRIEPSAVNDMLVGAAKR